MTISYINCYVYKDILCNYDLKVKMTIFIENGILVMNCKCYYNACMKYVAL
jgi:hypothetical protein